MGRESRRIRRERATVLAMVRMYCGAHHAGPLPCRECAALVEYADRRLERCPYGPDKPTCVSCPVHCYGAEPRDRIREVMRFAGPRMLRRHPVLALLHILDNRRPAPERPGVVCSHSE